MCSTPERVRLEENLRALAMRSPALAEQVARAPDDHDIVARTARDGTPGVGARPPGGGEALHLHSRYRPQEEANRVVGSIGAAATLVVFGMGGMFVPRAYLQRYRTASVIAVERSASTVRSVLESIDLTPELTTGRIRIVTASDQLTAALEEIHIPAIGDGLRVFELQPWAAWEPQAQLFERIGATLEDTLRGIAAELATMRHFGRPWLAHTVENTFRINWTVVPAGIKELQGLFRTRRARIFAAGPGLDRWFEKSVTEQQSASRDTTEIAVDTAVPALLKRGHKPDVVMSLDAQGWSPLHFRRETVPEYLLCADLGVSPQIVTAAALAIPVASNHPLHRLLYAAGFPLLFVPGTANVGEAAARIARGAGATAVDAVGADFGYPHGKSYSRGTYHYDIATARSSRLTSIESFFADQVYPRCDIDRDAPDGESPLFRTSRMQHAAQSFAEILRISGDDPRINGVLHSDRFKVPDIQSFWNSHLTALRSLTPILARAGELSTPELVEKLGPHGRAHLPLVADLENMSQRRNQCFPSRADRLKFVFSMAQGFIFSHLRRYSN